ncbi:MAG: hypothetical protein ACSHYA_00180 [Opitutaceae bacterium]
MNNKQLSLLSLGLLSAGSLLNAADGFVLFGESVEKPALENKFVRPLTAPYFHEDSFVTTDARAWYLSHNLDTIGGDVTVMALQLRVALTESLQLVAYKDGYTEFDGAAILGDNEGFNDIGAGLKWAFIQDWENQFHAAVGIGYEFEIGDQDVLQNTDELRLWVSANKGFGKLHLGATVNAIIANDQSEGLAGNSDMITAHFHADYYLTEWLSPVVEVSGYFSQDDGGLGVSGVDAGSLYGGGENDTITYAVGVELRPLCENSALRVAYEDELNSGVSLFGDRWTFSAIYEF